ncbi:MAG: phosphodiester glycosidase family protein [Oscillospiraceae bacterium]|nr:phosphodiester glycosidase family protein [Oscillospiraceae bacterium]
MRKILIPFLTLIILTIFINAFENSYYITSEELASGLEYKTMHAENQRAFVFEYTPNKDVMPVISFGDSVYGRVTMGDMIAGTNSVCAGINADFFSMQTGVPMGILINNGRLYSSSETANAIGFHADGTGAIYGAIIGQPDLDVTLSINGREEKTEHFNKYPTKYGIYILDSNYSDSTKSTLPSTEIVVKLDENQIFTQWCDITGIVTTVHRDVKNSKIEEGNLIISVANESTSFKNYQNVKVDDEVKITIRCDERWKDVVSAVGGGDIILNKGMKPDGIPDEEHKRLSNPRTAAGIKADGTVIFFAVDGRRPNYSNGLTLDELVSAMKNLGCVEAINLDGGGSTTVIVNDLLQNRPTDGEQRKISDAILFVNTAVSDGIPQYAKIKPNSPYVLSNGGKVKLEINIFDRAYNIIDMVPKNVEYSLSNEIGVIEDGIFTATVNSGSAILTVVADGIETSTVITIVPSLTDFDVIPERDRIPFGGEMQLNFNAYNKTYPVYASPERFDITCDSGYVDEAGVYHHEGYKDSATIKISYGYKVQYITFDVTDIPSPFADTANHWAESDIIAAYAHGIINGESINDVLYYYPERKITRSEFAKMLAVYCGFEIEPNDTEWDAPYINAVLKAELMQGKLMPDGMIDFSGGDYITRAEMIYVLAQFIESDTVELEFKDISLIPDWAVDRFKAAVSSGLINGYIDNTIRPNLEVSRAETASMFIRLIKLK